MEYLTKREQFVDGMKVVFDWYDESHEGEVVIEGKQIFICQNVTNGLWPKDKRGYDFGWALCGSDGECFLDDNTSYSLDKIRPAKSSAKTPKPKKYNFTTKYELNGEYFNVEKRKEKLAELEKKRNQMNKDIAKRRNEIRAFERWVGK